MLGTGHTRIEALLAAEECGEVIAECQRLFADEASAHPRDKPHSGTRHLEGLDRRIPLVGDVLNRSRLTELVAQVTNWSEDPPAPTQVSLRSPEPGFGGQDLHRDTVESKQGERPTAVTAIIALVDFTVDNGATRLVPGSHLTNESADRFSGRRRSPQEIVLTGPAGTAFLFSGHILHSGTENQSDAARPALQVLWRQGGRHRLG